MHICHILIFLDPGSIGQKPHRMFSLLLFLMARFDRFQAWFDHRFGWFFTNGMKASRQQRPGTLRV